MNCRFACPLIAGLIAALPAFASAELYKWIDETGAVTYGDAPPPQAKSVRVLGKDSGSLSVVPGIAPERLERMRETASELRLKRLEVEMEELRMREQALARAQRELSYSEPTQTVYWGGGYGPATRLRRDGVTSASGRDLPHVRAPISTFCPSKGRG